jgi:hypothetical protein
MQVKSHLIRQLIKTLGRRSLSFGIIVQQEQQLFDYEKRDRSKFICDTYAPRDKKYKRIIVCNS